MLQQFQFRLMSNALYWIQFKRNEMKRYNEIDKVREIREIT